MSRSLHYSWVSMEQGKSANERVFSGMRPTGRLHLGNYFGALKQWVELQDSFECVYCVVDLHALTTAYEDVSQIHEGGLEMVADWIGAGVDPEQSIIFRQSAVPEHSELALLLGMVTPKSWLERVPTYKGQIAELGDKIDTFGFFGYPVLQTADIALYKAEICTVFSYEKLFDAPADRVEEIERTCRSGELGCVDHKKELAERVVEYLRPIRERRQQAIEDKGELERILDEGAERARELAVPVIEQARKVMGL